MYNLASRWWVKGIARGTSPVYEGCGTESLSFVPVDERNLPGTWRRALLLRCRSQRHERIALPKVHVAGGSREASHVPHRRAGDEDLFLASSGTPVSFRQHLRYKVSRTLLEAVRARPSPVSHGRPAKLQSVVEFSSPKANRPSLYWYGAVLQRQVHVLR